jgi:hypothetical protein
VSNQERRLPTGVIRFILGVAMGLAVGFAVGWWLWPVEYTNTAPPVLRRDYRDDYVLMTATAYAVGGDLEQARERLQLLDPADPVAPVIELSERIVAAGGSAEDVTRLTNLAWALGPLPQTPTPYLENQPE